MRKDYLVNSKRKKLGVDGLEEKYRNQSPKQTPTLHRKTPIFSVRKQI